MFKSLFIANRGEIAVRVIRAAREIGIHTIAAYSEADAGALWTRLADEAHCIGPAPATDSYLNIEKLVNIARAAGASAVHPGYGLLSESAEFARAVTDAGIVFVGPDAASIATMGDKVAARRAAQACGVPVLPGSDAPVDSYQQALELANSIGWPVVVKASFGGGGRGLRVAATSAELSAALEQAAREAAAAFGRAEVFLEKYLVRPRHVEIQILGDSYGNLIHLGDRDCSVQRRHQKLLEEAPAPALPARLRERIAEAALTLCRSVRYRNAGTVEFLVDVSREEFFFLEMNTRLQVEHGVTELVTGIDLVREQIRIASGLELAIQQHDVIVRGHAIQARITAEDPWNGFRPSPGRIGTLALPLGPWLRLDFGVSAGDNIPQYYDSMFGKVQAWGADRDEARRRLHLALEMLSVDGVPTTAPYLRTLLNQKDYADATHDTGSLERDWMPSLADRPQIGESSPAVTSRRTSERRVSLPWGGRNIDVAIYGEIRGNSATSISHRPSQRRDEGAKSGGDLVTAPMDAVVISVLAAPGREVAKADPVLVLEAMKMEVIVRAPHDGTVRAVYVSAGETVRTSAKLVLVTAAGSTA